MLLRVRAPAFLEDDDEQVIELPDTWSFAARRLDDQSLANYVDEALMDVGVSGGELWLRRDDGCWYVDIDYWCAAALSTGQLEELLQEARGQLSDGAGACMELEEAEELEVILSADEDEATLLVIDDGKLVLPVSKVALHAKNGETNSLRTALATASREDIGRLHGGLSPLAWTCLNGHVEAAFMLLEAGAPPRDASVALDKAEQFDPLRTCVFSGSCTDEDSLRILQALVERGVSDDFDFLAEQASNRKKIQLATYLRELP